jgi:hypothetical protein
MEETPTSNPIHAHKNISGSGVYTLQCLGIRASSSADAAGRQLDLELVAAFT